ncbi:hypothetical protein D5S18_16535 [Nocardia panacis]|uniref:Serine hydrolase n=1 Tax=Nocardia panacis TaxID=2340916 RepID=A0A3A4KH56_9NOCA|nr:hypothetical protein [Nocardia panacis]RJO75328.1 hypothetical protein D5S18_16535 [Nocardia panacis]
MLLALTGCTQRAHDRNQETITEAAARTEQAGLAMTVPGTLAAGFADLQSTVKGRIGMAIMPVGGDRAVSFGAWTSGPAWSTMKVPLTIAALRRNPALSTYAAANAITQSDNAAADVLWQSLGTSQEAAQAVEAVLREGGDAKTAVPAARARADASAFGQADWALTDQVEFASRLPCLAQSGTVVNLMQQITPQQRWGLGAFNNAQYKGGWGPDPQGAYLVRQFGLVPAAGGQFAVAFAAQPDSGVFNDGMTLLDRMTTLITQHLGELSGGKCQG